MPAMLVKGRDSWRSGGHIILKPGEWSAFPVYRRAPSGDQLTIEFTVRAARSGLRWSQGVKVLTQPASQSRFEANSAGLLREVLYDRRAGHDWANVQASFLV
jgi:hypothetical protein